MVIRLQLSLYVPPPLDRELESVRRLLDPVQFDLIPAHVTLCREDELDEPTLTRLTSGLLTAEASPITLRFGRPEPFYEHGVLLPCIAGEDSFHALRQRILVTRACEPRMPHITLAHPRNPKSPYNSGSSGVVGLPGDLAITFASIFLIRQHGSAPWRVIESFTLEKAGREDASYEAADVKLD